MKKKFTAIKQKGDSLLRLVKKPRALSAQTTDSSDKVVKSQTSARGFSLNFLKKRRKVVIIVLVVVIISVGIILGWDFYKKSDRSSATSSSSFSYSCDPLTLVSLKQLYNVSQVPPTSGEKCTVNSDAYFIKLGYEDSTQAEKAKFGLMSETVGKRMQFEGADSIISDGNTSAFFIEGNELMVLIMFETTYGPRVEEMVLNIKNGSQTQAETETEDSTSIFNFGGKATDSRIKSDVSQLQAALEIYFADNEAYPETLEELVAANVIKTIPTNPKTDKPYDFVSSGESFTISTTLSDGSLYKVNNR